MRRRSRFDYIHRVSSPTHPLSSRRYDAIPNVFPQCRRRRHPSRLGGKILGQLYEISLELFRSPKCLYRSVLADVETLLTDPLHSRGFNPRNKKSYLFPALRVPHHRATSTGLSRRRRPGLEKPGKTQKGKSRDSPGRRGKRGSSPGI